jgi:hypothetical protein
LSPYLHPYPLNFLEYLPRFPGGDHVIAKRRLEAFENFIDQFEIVHDDVNMRLFFNSLFGDVAIWFRSLRAHSICSWINLSNVFLNNWGENKYFDQYLTEFHDLRRGEEETMVVFNQRFYNLYHYMPSEIRYSVVVAMVYYVRAQHSEIFLLRRERKYSSLACLFEYAREVEENIRASRRI